MKLFSPSSIDIIKIIIVILKRTWAREKKWKWVRLMNHIKKSLNTFFYHKYSWTFVPILISVITMTTCVILFLKFKCWILLKLLLTCERKVLWTSRLFKTKKTFYLTATENKFPNKIWSRARLPFGLHFNRFSFLTSLFSFHSAFIAEYCALKCWKIDILESFNLPFSTFFSQISTWNFHHKKRFDCVNKKWARNVVRVATIDCN